MSQNPLESLKRREPAARRAFPDPIYDELLLQPVAAAVAERLLPEIRDVQLAHAIQLAEQRVIDADAAARALRDAGDAGGIAPPSAELALAGAREETLAAATRLALRDRALDFAEQVLDVRTALAELATAHLTTTMLTTANGQTVQPTTLAHYLVGQLPPLARTHQRLRETFARLNRSPLGAASGMSTAMPVRRERAAALLGFDGPLEHTFDAIAAEDVVAELLSVVALAAAEGARLVNDLAVWARDDAGLLTPGVAFLHPDTSQPQRHDPRVLDALRARFARHAAAFGAAMTALPGRQMLGGEDARLEVFRAVDGELLAVADSYRLLAAVIRAAEVNRALFAARANRGFATSSELADLLTIDFKLPPGDARRLADKVVVEATEAGLDTASLKPELIDAIALRELGREIGIEPEMLSRCLAPKRFLERRDVLGGPAPAAMRAALDREAIAERQEAAWLRERRGAIAAARAGLIARRDEILADPSSAWRRPTEGRQVDAE